MQRLLGSSSSSSSSSASAPVRNSKRQATEDVPMSPSSNLPERKGDPLYDFDRDRSRIAFVLKNLLQPVTGLAKQHLSAVTKTQKMIDQKSVVIKSLRTPAPAKYLKELSAESKADSAAYADELAEKNYSLLLHDLQKKAVALSNRIDSIRLTTHQKVLDMISRLPPNSPFPTREKIEAFINDFIADQTAAAIAFSIVRENKKPPKEQADVEVKIPDEQVALKTLIQKEVAAKVKQALSNSASKNARGRAGKPAAAQAAKKKSGPPRKKSNRNRKPSQQQRNNKSKSKAASGPGKSKSKARKPSKKGPTKESKRD
jgi:hypothetical protein